MIQYTQEKTIQDLEAALKGGILNLYREDCIGRSGDCSGNGRAYGDVMAEHLLDRTGFVHALRLQKAVPRTTSYFPDRNKDSNAPNPNSQRLEEQLVKQWVDAGRNFEHLGKCVYFQMPLSNVETDAFGAVDLVTYEATSKTLWLVEVKSSGNQEGLLKPVLQIATYGAIADRGKVAADAKAGLGLQVERVRLAVLAHSVGANTPPSKSFSQSDLLPLGLPKLAALAEMLGVEIIASESTRAWKVFLTQR